MSFFEPYHVDAWKVLMSSDNVSDITSQAEIQTALERCKVSIVYCPS